MTTKKTQEQPHFEKSMERLERIVAEMEGGKLSLEDMIARFEEGQTLVKFCTRKLNEVEKRIEILVKKGDDEEAEPFDAEAVAEGAEEPPAAAPDKGERELF
jgi:exodeoxyribonuclease VII small subunit